jgi:acetyl-CoA carboxylase biotin carboxyl carrier protein
MLHEKELERDIRALADILDEKKLTSAFVKCGDYEIKLERRPAPVFGAPAASGSTAANVVNGNNGQAAFAAELPAGNAVRAPIVGTFYAAPSPSKPPFVSIGDSVKKGDVIFIIESMKLMNEVLSDFDGKVGEILVKNGEPLEYDQIVMTII